MLKIYNIKEKQEFLRQVTELTQKEWAVKQIQEKNLEEKYILKYFNDAILEESKKKD